MTFDLGKNLKVFLKMFLKPFCITNDSDKSYFFQFNNRNTRIRGEIYSKLSIKQQNDV